MVSGTPFPTYAVKASVTGSNSRQDPFESIGRLLRDRCCGRCGPARCHDRPRTRRLPRSRSRTRGLSAAGAPRRTSSIVILIPFGPRHGVAWRAAVCSPRDNVVSASSAERAKRRNHSSPECYASSALGHSTATGRLRAKRRANSSQQELSWLNPGRGLPPEHGDHVAVCTLLMK